MSGLNKVMLIGNLGCDPELRHTSNGLAVANFRMATNEKWNDKNGQKQERTEWHRIVAWGKLAETCEKHLSKGRQIYLEGSLGTKQWEDRDGNKRQTTEIIARNIVFIGRKDQAASDTSGPNHQTDESWPDNDQYAF